MRVCGSVVINLIIITGSLAVHDKKKNNPKSIAEITDLPSVTHFEGIEKFYQGLRTSNNAGPAPLEPQAWRKRMDVKKKLCKSIFTSRFFEMRSEEYLDTDLKEVRAELARDEELSDTFASLYKLREKPAFFLFFWDRDEFRYENAYKPRSIHVGSVVSDEHMFACVVRSNGRIKDYFVTKPYNVNQVEEGLAMVGRFIFARNTNGDLALAALAEEPAEESGWARKSSLIEISYIASRSNTKRVRLSPRTDDGDPVCRLSHASKLRLCSTIFSAKSRKFFGGTESSFKRDELEFKPVINQERLNCLQKKVSYTSIGSGTFGGWVAGKFLRWGEIDEFFVERMIACVGTTPEGFERIYYASGGTSESHNNVYVFTDADFQHGRVSLFNLYVNVSVVKNPK